MPDFGALTFASPAMLAALAGLPAIWLILRATPPQPRKAPFPAFRLLLGLKDRERTKTRTPIFLLLLRLTIAALIVVGLAGPALNAPETGDPDERPILVVVDDSWTAAADWRLRENALRLFAEEARRERRAVYLVTTAPSAAVGAEAPQLFDGEAFASAARVLSPSALLPDHAAAAARIDAIAARPGGLDIRWLSDGVEHPATDELRASLRRAGDPTTYVATDAPILHIAGRGTEDGADAFILRRVRSGSSWAGELVVAARDGRELAREQIEFEAGEAEVRTKIALPIALRNQMAAARIEGVAAAGAVRLLDGRSARSLIGIVDGGVAAGGDLLMGASYIRAALDPYAAFFNGAVSDLIASDADVIVLDDVGRLRVEDVEALTDWATRGGIILRFAGPVLAEAAQDGDAPLLPVQLRGGGRAFGGALSWDSPQRLAQFAENGPFADIPVPDEPMVKRQVLASPGAETTERTWASLADQTPLVTGQRIGKGALVLFHVTATPAWSELPLSGVFVEMLRRIALLAAVREGPTAPAVDVASELSATVDEPSRRFAAVRLMDGFGILQPPSVDAASITLADASLGPAAEAPPGLYGDLEAPLAVNAITDGATFAPLAEPVGARGSYADAPTRRLAAPLFLAALALLGVDALAALHYAGLLSSGKAARVAALFAAVLVSVAMSADQAEAQTRLTGPAAGQPFDAPIEDKTFEAAATTRLAFVETGDGRVDQVTQFGLRALGDELYRRTAVEPGDPQAVDPETDDLSVYPLLYWPIIAGAQPPSDAALANLELFMRFGGLVVFDTRDDERVVDGAASPERAALRDLLLRLDVPPLRPLPEDHVLKRSFYLLSDLNGRAGDGELWVAAAEAENDGVTSILIGGRDWAGAWARDEMNQPLRPMRSVAAAAGCSVRQGVPPRECAYRAGVNIVLVALTGNYKSDQVHTPTLLERLGRR